MEENINQYFAKDSIFLLGVDDDDDDLVPYKNTDSAFKMEERGDLVITRKGASIAVETDVNKYFSTDSIFRSDEDEIAKQIKNQWKPTSYLETNTNENKIPSATFDGEEVLPAKTPEPKEENSSNFAANVEVDDDDYLLPLNYKMEERGDFGFTKSASIAGKNDISEYIEIGSEFLSDDENENSGHVKNQWKPRLSRESITHKDQTFSPTCDEKEILPGQTPGSENSSNFVKIDDTTSVTQLPSRKSNTQDRICVRTFRSVKGIISSKCDEIWSALSNKVKRDNEGLLMLVSTFWIPDECTSVSSITSYEKSQCWVAVCGSTQVLLYTRDGKLVESVNVGYPVDSLTTDKHGNVYMSCPDVKQVRVFNQNRQVKTFKDMTDFPRGIAYMKLCESILVCRNNKIIADDMPSKPSNAIEKYRISGTKPKSEKVTKCTFGYPLRVCVNVNSDCIVSDFANRSITVIDSMGRTRFCFKSSTEYSIYNKHSVCCDREGHIYIFSKGAPNVCVLESNGNVKYMFTCLDLCDDSYFAAAFDTDGYLWLASLNGIIKIFKVKTC